MAFWNRIKSTYDVARETGIEEEKIKELKEGKREITGETMDKVLKAINKTETEKAIEKATIYQWYLETDLANERKKFGYKNQKELALAINMNNTVICKLEKKKIEKVNNDMIKLYDFYHNDFNINIENHELNENEQEVWEWYKGIQDLKAYRREFGYSLNKLMLILNISYDQLRDFENHHYKKYNKTIQLFYDFYNNEENRLPKRNDLQYVMPMDKPVFKWYMESDFNDLRKKMGGLTISQLAQKVGISTTSMCEIVSHKQRVLSKSVQLTYDYFNSIGMIENSDNNEEKGENDLRIPEDYAVEVIEDNNSQEEKLGEVYEYTSLEEENQPLTGVNTESYVKQLEEEIKNLKIQISRYEKLIDRM